MLKPNLLAGLFYHVMISRKTNLQRRKMLSKPTFQRFTFRSNSISHIPTRFRWILTNKNWVEKCFHIVCDGLLLNSRPLALLLWLPLECWRNSVSRVYRLVFLENMTWLSNSADRFEFSIKITTVTADSVQIQCWWILWFVCFEIYLCRWWSSNYVSFWKKILS